MSLAFIGTSAALASSDWYVSQTGLDSNPGTQAEPFATIEYALSQSIDGDSINIAQGIYYERDLDTSNLIITINGATDLGGSPATIIDGFVSGISTVAPIFWMDDNGTTASPKTSLNNLVLRNGTGKYFPDQFNPNDSYTMGGAVYVGSRSHLDMTNCVLSNNTANVGGALAFEGDQTETYWGPATGTIVDTTFMNNSAELPSLVVPNNNAGSGGAVWSQLADPKFERCYFDYNVANARLDLSGPGTGGGAMHLNDGIQYNVGSTLIPEVTNCNFTGNTSTFVGGAIAIVAINPVIDSCGITNNNATGDLDVQACGPEYQGGAGIYTWDSTATIENCTITSNQTSYGSGAGIYSSGTISGYVPEISNTNITNNYSASNGGGIAVNSYPVSGDIYTANTWEMNITNCNVSSNVADGNGGGIYFGRNSNASVKETLVANNNTTYGNGAGVFMQESAIADYEYVTIADNKVLSTTAAGGGMFLVGGQWDGTDDCKKGDGGAIADITNSNFSNNNSNQTGGAVFMMGNANCTITSTTIQGNTAVQEGGGFQLQYNAGDVNRNPILVLNDCDVVNNATTTPITDSDLQRKGSGGGLFVDVHCKATINNGLISENNCQVPAGTSPAVPGAWTCYGELIANSDSPYDLKICLNSNNDNPNPGGACTGPECQYFVDSNAVLVLSPNACVEFTCNNCVPIVYPEDIDGDGDVDIDDVRAVQAAAGICTHDNNGDGKTDIEDLLNLIEGWGTSCNP